MNASVSLLLVAVLASADPSSPTPNGTSPVTPSTTARTGVNGGAAPAGGLIAEIAVDTKPTVAATQVSMHRSRVLRSDPDSPVAKSGRPPEWGYMNVLLELSGSVVGRAVRVGNLRVGTSRDDKGNDLLTPPTKEGISYNPAQNNRLDFRNLNAPEQSTGKISFAVHQMAAARGAETFSVFGSIDLVIGGQRKALDVGALTLTEEVELQHSELSKLGMKVTLTKPPAGYSNPNRKDTIFAVKIVGSDAMFLGFETRDANGKATEAQTYGIFGTGDQRVRVYRFASPPPVGKTPLFVLVQSGAELLTVPFDLKDIPAP